MNMLSKNKVIDKLQSKLNYWKGSPIMFTVQAIKDDIERDPDLDVWINCLDYLPTNKQKVIIYTSNAEMFFATYDPEVKQFYNDNKAIYSEVTHWMPYPDSPIY